ncbi:hypothetical protein KDL01_09230 [Actinospica durhamensis]|uniref:Lanthionine synthetase C family protein n=1 Tax=Actinospica durhamensis TaxID=1508375 RepID=A0A941EKU2_9ACTN|nr:lanthionine synthetase LanC family protein [Actinospica durhamensis]MBR7833447.1 hypothetical protein [Actinospica durhamensis]
MKIVQNSAQIQRAEDLGRQGLDWLLAQARPTGSGLAWSWAPSGGQPMPGLYYGTSGVILALLEGWRHFHEDRYADAALRGARYVAEAIAETTHDSLYLGLTGMAFGLRAADRALGDGPCGAAADRALALVRAHFDGERWNEMFELMAGNAGIGLGALAAGDPELALLAVQPYALHADETAGGVNWQVRPTPPHSHHMAHGTLGIAYALAAVGRAAGRGDLIELAQRGAADVVSRNTAGPTGFLVPHSNPPHRPDIIETYSYGWCNGPAGDAQLFRLLEQITGDEQWTALIDRCRHSVQTSGLPQRLRPGFWDNNGRCCGTAGVLALACDLQCDRVDAAGTDDFADLLAADLIDRASLDENGASWANFEHRNTPGELEPHTGWAHGTAGIVPELLRYARIAAGGDPTYATSMPDHAPVCSSTAGKNGDQH